MAPGNDIELATETGEHVALSFGKARAILANWEAVKRFAVQVREFTEYQSSLPLPGAGTLRVTALEAVAATAPGNEGKIRSALEVR